MKKGSKRCSYCNKKATEVIYVCPDHAKVLDRLATRRKKLPVPVVEPEKIVEPEKVVEPEEEKKEK